jgi:hypothetical protein
LRLARRPWRHHGQGAHGGRHHGHGGERGGGAEAMEADDAMAMETGSGQSSGSKPMEAWGDAETMEASW